MFGGCRPRSCPPPPSPPSPSPSISHLLATHDALILTAGATAASIPGLAGLPIKPVRGQNVYYGRAPVDDGGDGGGGGGGGSPTATAVPPPPLPLLCKKYVIPKAAADEVLVGATWEHPGPGVDLAAPPDVAAAAAALADEVAGLWGGAAPGGGTGWRPVRAVVRFFGGGKGRGRTAGQAGCHRGAGVTFAGGQGGGRRTWARVSHPVAMGGFGGGGVGWLVGTDQ